MRFLVSPVYMTIVNMRGSSTYNHVKNLIRELVDRGHFVYWHLPENFTYEPDPLEQHERVKVIRTEMYVDQYIEGSHMRGLEKLFSRLDGKYSAIDGVITSRTPIIPLLKALIETPSVKQMKNPHLAGGKRFTGHAPTVPFFVLESFPKIIDDAIPINPVEYRNQSYGYQCSERVYFGGITDYENVMNDQRSLAPFSMVKKFREDVFRIAPFGVKIEKLDHWSQGQPPRTDPKNGPLKIISLGRIRTANHAKTILEQSDYLHRMGYEVDFKIPTSANRGSLPQALNKELKTVMEHVNILWGTPQDKFFEYMFAAHAAVVSSKSHNFPTAILEAIYGGVCVVVRPEKWIKFYLGDDYPFYYDGSHEHLITVLNYIRNNFEKSQAELAPYRKLIAEKFDSKECMSYIAEDIISVAEESFRTGTTSGGFRDILSKIPKDVESITFDEVLKFIDKTSNNPLRIGFLNSTGFLRTRGMVDYCMRQEGWIDASDHEFPRYVRGGVVQPQSKSDTETDDEQTV